MKNSESSLEGLLLEFTKANKRVIELTGRLASLVAEINTLKRQSESSPK